MITCTICEKQFRTRYNLTCHKKYNNCKKLIYQCDKCNKYFNKQVQYHNCQLFNDIIICEICNKSFSNKWNLIRHNKRINCIDKKLIDQVVDILVGIKN